MKDKTNASSQLSAAVDAALRENSGISVDGLCRRLRRMTRELRQHYLRVNGGGVRAPQDEWLCDNYYVIERECKQSIKDMRQIQRRAAPGELMRCYRILERVLYDMMPLIDDESVAEILTAAGRRGRFSERQYSFVSPAIKSVLIRMAWDACMERRDQELIRYAIVGIGRLASVDLETIVHRCSTVEQILLQDPAGVYPFMSSESRQHYRHLISCIGASEKKPEADIAREMLAKCRGAEGTACHIGYPILRHPAVIGPRRRRGKLAVALNILLPPAAAAILGALTGSRWVPVLCWLPLWEILRTPLTQLVMSGVEVDFLPRMDLDKVEERPKTAVLISMLLPKAAEAAALEKRLEQLYFSNSDPDMYYCILADFKEWDYPSDEKDESQVAPARKVIEGLNARYGGRFMLFLRSRTYNKTQNKYSGWERKRGAITEFVRFLKGDPVSLHTFAGDRSVLGAIRFLIALDSDTNLLYESAQTLVSVAIHPLNRPVVGEGGVVTEGYGILTPKMSADLQSAKATAFSRVLTGCGGVTAYDTRDKDFYQDLFGRSIFAGKGLIDADCFYGLLEGRFPENRILSHDILEGAYLRAGFVSDVEMTDSSPSSMSSWLARLHRWIRGDWQNVVFLARRYRAGGKTYENPIGRLSKYQLFDNLRRSATPVFSFACIAASMFAPPLCRAVLALTGILGVTFSSLWAAAHSLLTGGFFTLSRKFFTRTLPHTFELLGQALFFLIMLPAQTIIVLDAVVRSLWRTFVSHKRMLEWTTAAQSELRRVTFWTLARRYWAAELIGVLFLLLSTHTSLSLVGLVFALLLPVAYFSAIPSEEDGGELSGASRDLLISYNAAMWRYYEDFADRRNHYLPPDNVQQSPVYRVATRTSPTNIGMMMLSVLAARDFDFIDTDGLYLRVERTLSAVEGLEKWHGNLYNWYDTVTLETLKPEFVSTVDSGNFVCCLVALKEGLREFVAERPAFSGLIARVEALIEATDLLPFYNKKKKLFSIGWDVDGGELSDSHYDFLMSEARLTSYYAVARKLVDKKHWGTLGRSMSRSGSYAGAVSWTGTMFEYFMPHLLLPVYEGSLLGEALLYCLYCQKKRVRGQDVPWGISESAFYAFDNNLNYQYKAHGVQKLGVKRYLDRELVISPYSTFITLPLNPHSSMENLGRLRSLGVYGRYGFFEAVDFTAERVGKGALAVTRSYMAHHIGMSMVSSCNALLGNRMQKRFMRDHYMESAREFLQEKIAKNTVVFDELRDTEARGEKHERPKFRDESRAIRPRDPRCVLLTNGEITDILTDTGAGYLVFGGTDLTRRSTDLLRRAQGFFAVAKAGGTTLSATLAPFYDPDAHYSVEYEEQSVTYLAKKKDLEIGMRCLVHPTISCVQRQIAVKNGSAKRQKLQLLFYFEPVLSADGDYGAHPAYSKLFVRGSHDRDTGTLIFTRRGRDSAEEMFLTAGFLHDTDFDFELSRESLMSAPNGLRDLLRFDEKPFSGRDGGVPNCCCALRLEAELPPGSQQQFTLLLAAAPTRAEGIASIISMRKIGLLDGKNAAKSPLLGDSLEGRLGQSILGQLLFNPSGGGSHAEERARNRLGQSGLWGMSVSGDLPIALIEPAGGMEPAALESYLGLHASLRRLKIEFDLCILCDGEQSCAEVRRTVRKHSVPNILGTRGGVFVLDKSLLPPEQVTLLRAVARHSASRELVSDAGAVPWRPVELRRATPVPMPENPELAVHGGAYREGRFYVERTSPLPYSHILANPVFGTLVSDSALGFTWWLNSRENKLTPWYNDICTDNEGEMLLLREGDRFTNLVRGARASFSPDDALYESRDNQLLCTVRVSVSERGGAKYVDLTVQNLTDRERPAECAYCLEPVLGVTRAAARYIVPRREGNLLLLHNAYNTAVECHAALTAEGEDAVSFITSRADFLCGNWGGASPAPDNDPCAAAVVRLTLPPKGEKRVRFILAAGQTPRAAAEMARRPLGRRIWTEPPGSVRLNTPDPALNALVNTLLPHQIIASRIWGRTAFYQCGGAYGFRDQLQDVSACLFTSPELAKRQILRCCAVQFPEGDVLHWWHDLPRNAGGLKGVRTKFSDDLLWLPLAVSDYVRATGDASILSLPVRYIEAEPLGNDHERYISPRRSELSEDVFAHCVRALEKGHSLGENDLPLIGCGDWNDGFSAVGLEGRGTSTWLALFLSLVLTRFAGVCALRGEEELREKYLGWAGALREAVDRRCWDGDWYVRAFFDNGEPMGSRRSEECQIDLLPQSFAVLAGMPDGERVRSGMESAHSRLVDRRHRLVRLFDPAFQHSAQRPGYVRAYPSGIRENGGQYTHAAVWFAIALLEEGRADEGWEILQMLNPSDRAARPGLAEIYKLEPYYIAADIYTNAGASGRGGWSMYTGAASWYFRAVMEWLLGVRLRGDHIELRPRLPAQWPGAELQAVLRGTSLHISIVRGETPGILCDGAAVARVPLDGGDHEVKVTIR